MGVVSSLVVNEIKNAVISKISEGLGRKDTLNTPVVVSNPIKTAEEIGNDIEARIAKDPVLQNELNLEPKHKSRVVVGGTAASFGIVISAIAQGLVQLGYDVPVDVAYWTQLISSVMVVWGVGYSLYGRLKSGLKPLFTK